MTSPDLFSHPSEPEVVRRNSRDSEPVQLPSFSDRPQSNPVTPVD